MSETVESENTVIEEKIEQIDEQLEQVDSNENQDANEIIENSSKKVMIPLSVAQKLREQKRELELQLQWEQQKNAKAQVPVEDDDSIYETATRHDVSKSQEDTIRAVEERIWIKQNPEKFERINTYLPQFLKERPNLAPAINLSQNRYEEAYSLMDALSPKQQKQLVKGVVKPQIETPSSPSSVSKAAAIQETVDVMGLSDKEFSEWRKSKRRAR